MKRVLPIIAAVFLTAAAAWFRFAEINRRPVHTDEAVHAVKTDQLLDTGRYVYNPAEYHGPILYYPPWLALKFAGKSFAEIPHIGWLRFSPALTGLLLVVSPLLGLALWGWPTTLAMMALTAFSPAFVFFSPYYIQEMGLVLFTFWALLSGRWLLARPSGKAAVALGLSVGLMFATKETALLALIAMISAAAILLGRQGQLRVKIKACTPLLFLAGILALLVAATALTHFWTRPVAFFDLFWAYGFYVGRGLALDSAGGGADWHHQPFWTYARLFFAFRAENGPFWSEAAILLCVVPLFGPGNGKGRRPGNFVSVLALYTLFLFLIYSLIPYKTPWNGLSFLHGFILLGGLGVGRLWQSASRPWQKGLVLLGLVLICAHLGAQARRATTTLCADPRNPYVYGHTSTNLKKLAQRLDGLAEAATEGKAMSLAVIARGGDYWPLPWHLRGFSQVGYWESPEDFFKQGQLVRNYAVILGKSEDLAGLSQRLEPNYLAEIYGLRPHVLLECHIRRELWSKYMEQR